MNWFSKTVWHGIKLKTFLTSLRDLKLYVNYFEPSAKSNESSYFAP